MFAVKSLLEGGPHLPKELLQGELPGAPVPVVTRQQRQAGHGVKARDGGPEVEQEGAQTVPRDGECEDVVGDVVDVEMVLSPAVVV